MNPLHLARSRLPLRRWAERALPPGSGRRDAARIGRQLGSDGLRYARRVQMLLEMTQRRHPREPRYREWFRDNSARVEDLIEQIDIVAARDLALTGIVVVDASRDADLVADTTRSLDAQTVGGWRQVVRTDPTTGLLDDVPGDPADWLVFLEAGDVAEPDLLFHVAVAGRDDPTVELVSWDDDELDGAGVPSHPLIHPSWSPETLLGANYLGRSFAIRRRTLARAESVFAGGGDGQPDASDARWWRLLLAAGLTAEQTKRVPRVLNHLVRRPAPSSDESIAVVAEHLERAGREADLSWVDGVVRLRWRLPDDPPSVTVVIPTRHNREQLSVCLPSLARTDYPNFDVVIIDNGGHTVDHEAWYRSHGTRLDLSVKWWTQPFNFSAVNNAAAAESTSDVLVFLNDDTELRDPGWLTELVGWASQPDIGLAGAQLIGPDGEIQHGGVIVGLNGFADHLFQGMAPHSDSLMGPTDWYRNTLSVTAACVAVRREVFERIGGFDEGFILCGSDVVLGLDAHFLGLRNVVTPFTDIRHHESATRSTDVPESDFFASYWWYQRWMFGGDPQFSPSLSLSSREPRFRSKAEPGPRELIAGPLRRDFTVFRQVNDSAEAEWMADQCRADGALVDAVHALHAEHRARFSPRTVNWFLPEIDSPFYGGVATVLRIADHLATHHGVQNQFIVSANPNEAFFRSALAAVFPAIADSPLAFTAAMSGDDLELLPYADVSIATLWTTAFTVAHFTRTKRKFYLVQDYEPQFYPAGTAAALAEESYRLGLYGICNTHRLMAIYRRRFGGRGGSFLPAVDRDVPATARMAARRVPRRRSPAARPRRARHRVHLRPARPHPQLLGARLAVDRPGEAALRRRRAHRDRGFVGPPRRHRARHRPPGAARLPRHRRALPPVRPRGGADGVGPSLVPPDRADGVGHAGGGVRQPGWRLDPARPCEQHPLPPDRRRAGRGHQRAGGRSCPPRPARAGRTRHHRRPPQQLGDGVVGHLRAAVRPRGGRRGLVGPGRAGGVSGTRRAHRG